MMSEVMAIETQGAASPIANLTRVAVLLRGPDGWRCYEAFHILPLSDRWEENKAAAAEWTRTWGNKITPKQAGRYFNITDDMEFAA